MLLLVQLTDSTSRQAKCRWCGAGLIGDSCCTTATASAAVTPLPRCYPNILLYAAALIAIHLVLVFVDNMIWPHPSAFSRRSFSLSISAAFCCSILQPTQQQACWQPLQGASPVATLHEVRCRRSLLCQTCEQQSQLLCMQLQAAGSVACLQ
jgi:hypothetical protein